MKIELQAIENLEEADKRVRLLFDAGEGNFAIVTVRVTTESDSLAEIKEAAINKMARLWSSDLSPDTPHPSASSFS